MLRNSGPCVRRTKRRRALPLPRFGAIGAVAEARDTALEEGADHGRQRFFRLVLFFRFAPPAFPPVSEAGDSESAFASAA